MIAKSDILILSVASALLIFTLMRSTLFSAPDTQVVQYQRPASSNVSSTNTSITSATNQTVSTQDLNPQPATSLDTTNQTIAQNDGQIQSTGDITTVSSTNNAGDLTVQSEVQQPEIIREAAFKTHVVQSGEYLSLLAQRYNTTVSTLIELNNLTGSTIYVGQKLVYPDP